MEFRLPFPAKVASYHCVPSALLISDLSVSFGKNPILSDVNAEIHAGEFIGVFGPNGAGKTTLMRCLLGTLRPSHGTVTLFGLPPVKASREIGYMPQGNVGFESTALSARALVHAAWRGEKWGIPWSSRESRAEVERVLEMTHSESYADRPFSVLSGGERQRIMLAQALLGKPKMLILDEPLASLDPKNQALLIECIAEVKRVLTATILFVAHDMNPLLHVMDRVFYLAGGGALLGEIDEVVNSEALSHLYKFPIEVVRADKRVFILSKEGNVTEAACHD
jgi:zinc/manganese transport system ATP-binding protein